jgi:hypothetical protein
VTTLGLPGVHVPIAGEADSDDQHTPAWLLGLVAELWPGGIDTDPCWSPLSLVRARLTYDGTSAEQDGLCGPWVGRVWCNPPYSDPAPWADRMREHMHPARSSAEPREGLLLVNVSTSVRWFHRARPGALPDSARIAAFFDRRIAFIKDGAERRGNDREQMMLWWGPSSRVRALRKVFGHVAWVTA